MRTSPGNCQWRHKVRAASHIAPTTFHIIAYFVGAAAADITMASVASEAEAAALDIRKATTIEERIDTSPGSLAQLSP